MSKINMTGKKYLVFDLETTGFPLKVDGKYGKYFHPKELDKYDPSRIVEIAYVLLDENFNQITTFQTIIKPDFKINNSHIHGITDEKANESGSDMKEILDRIKIDFDKADVLVAHNIQFDYCILLSESYRYQNHDMIDILNEKKTFCTMKEFVNYRKAVNPNSKEFIKFPKLTEMYTFFFGSPFQGAHSALYDCQACALCFREIIKKISV